MDGNGTSRRWWRSGAKAIAPNTPCSRRRSRACKERPARVTLGVALLSEENRHGAFGHAWAEILEDGQWKVADAALLDAPATVRYLPMGVLDDEGMGYSMELARLLNGWVERVVVLGAVK